MEQTQEKLFSSQPDIYISEPCLSIAGLPPPALSSPQGQKLTFFGRCQLVTEIFFQLPNGKMWSPKSVGRTFPLQQNTRQNFGRHRLACKIFAIDVIRNQTSAEVIFSTL